MKATTIEIKFINCVWDNYQGGCGKVILQNICTFVPEDTPVKELRGIATEFLKGHGYRSDFHVASYDQSGIIELKIHG